MKRFILATTTATLSLFSYPAAAQDNPFAAAAPANPFTVIQDQRYTGIFESDAVRLELKQDGDAFNGSLYYSATKQIYEVSARVTESRLEGDFLVSGTSFPFSFVRDAAQKNSRFETEGYSGILTARSAAPPSLSQIYLINSDALSLLDAVPTNQRGYVISSIVNFLARSGDIDGAEQLVESLPTDDPYREAALVGLASGVLQAEGIESARLIMSRVITPSMRGIFDNGYAAYLVDEGLFTDAFEFASGIKYTASSVGAFINIARAAREAGDSATEEKAINAARALAFNAASGTERNGALFSLARAYAQMNDPAAALDIIKGIKDDYFAVIAYTSIAELLVQEDNRQAAAKIADLAFKKAKDVKPKVLRPTAVATVISIYAALRDVEGMKNIQEWVQSRGKVHGSVMWMNLIRTQIRLRYMDAARSNAANIDSAAIDDEILQAVAYDQVDSGKVDAALLTVKEISSPATQALSLSHIALTLHQQAAE